MKKIILSLVIGIISFCFVSCSKDEEEYIDSTESYTKCAISYIENAIIKNYIDYDDPIYTTSSLTVLLPKYNNYSKDFYKNDNYKSEYWRSNIKNKLEYDFDLKLEDNGYCYTSGYICVNNLGWCECAEIEFKCKLYNDYITIYCNPNRPDYVYMEISCKHTHLNQILK